MIILSAEKSSMLFSHRKATLFVTLAVSMQAAVSYIRLNLPEDTLHGDRLFDSFSFFLILCLSMTDEVRFWTLCKALHNVQNRTYKTQDLSPQPFVEGPKICNTPAS